MKHDIVDNETIGKSADARPSEPTRRGFLPLLHWTRGLGRRPLEFGAWSFFGIWSLGFGSFPRPTHRLPIACSPATAHLRRGLSITCHQLEPTPPISTDLIATVGI